MDNASFHRFEKIVQMCSDRGGGGELVYLPSYPPDLNPDEYFFAELKVFIWRHWQSYEENPSQGFDGFLRWCVDVVIPREQSAKGYFRQAGLNIVDT
jgi:transposase